MIDRKKFDEILYKIDALGLELADFAINHGDEVDRNLPLNSRMIKDILKVLIAGMDPKLKDELDRVMPQDSDGFTGMYMRRYEN